jgi:hypothetical protein
MRLRRALQITAVLIAAAALFAFVTSKLGIGPCGGPGLPYMLLFFLFAIAALIFVVIDLVWWARRLWRARQMKNGGA